MRCRRFAIVSLDRTSAAAALVHLAQYAGEAIEPLRPPLALSHSGRVRLVDRLVDAGQLERREAGDARGVALHLTRKGRAAAADGLRRREEVLCARPPIAGGVTRVM
jgi:DNA-binding MarR family transcriptional regulator